MTLTQLRVFVAVARHEHMTRAAESLHLAQSAASAAITALEAEHGVQLFDRVGRSIRLSAVGHAFLPDACAVLEGADRASAKLRGVDRKTRLDARETC
jgi:DNA-binding transcriptional LysR family regulator